MDQEFLEKYLSIDQTIQDDCYAIESSWFEQFQESLFAGGESDIGEINNYSICICNEETIQRESLRAQICNRFSVEASVRIMSTVEQKLKADKLIIRDFVLVNAGLWDLLVSTFSGGPIVPVHTITYEETSVSRCVQQFPYISNRDLDQIPMSLIAPLDYEVFQVVIQKEDFQVLQLSLPLMFTIEQIQKRILSRHCSIGNYSLYDPHLKKWLTNSTMVSELKNRQIWVLKNSIKASMLQIYVPEFDEFQISQDFQQLRNKERSTGPSTKDSQEILNTSLDLTQQIEIIEVQEDVSKPYLCIEDFRDTLNQLINSQKISLKIKEKSQLLDNLNSILGQLDSELAVLKKTDVNDKTNDELLEQDDI